jgi:hypothetical protein
LAPSIQLDSAHAGHTDLHGQACRVQLMRGVRYLTVIRFDLPPPARANAP